MTIGSMTFQLLEIEYENIQSTLCSDFWIFLAQRTCCRISRVFEWLFIRQFLLFYKAFKTADRHINFTAYLNERNIGIQFQWNITNGFQVRCNILADKTVAAGGSTHQQTIPILQGNGETVDFRFDNISGIRDFLTDFAVEIPHFLFRKHILQRTHLHRMHNGFETVFCHAAHAVSNGIGSQQLRILLLQFHQLMHHSVKLKVGNFRLVKNIILIAVLLQFFSQRSSQFFRFFKGHFFTFLSVFYVIFTANLRTFYLKWILPKFHLIITHYASFVTILFFVECLPNADTFHGFMAV